MVTADPFDACPDADPQECEVRTQRWRPKETVGLGSTKPKRKKTDLNPMEKRWLEAQGYTWARVDRANAWGAVNVDLWGVFDYIAVKPEEPGVLFVQVTELSNLSHRRRKILAAPETAVLLAAGNRVEIHAWSQDGGKGSRWEMRIEAISALDAGRVTTKGRSSDGKGTEEGGAGSGMDAGAGAPGADGRAAHVPRGARWLNSSPARASGVSSRCPL